MLNLSPRLAEPFFFKGNSTGLVLIHGFTGSPSEMRFLGERLAVQGFTVAGILLSGHGTVPEELANTSWPDWLKDAEDGVAQLRQTCDKVLAIGLSMGGLLALELATRNLVDGVVALNAPIILVDWRTRFVGLAKPFVSYVEKSVVRERSTTTIHAGGHAEVSQLASEKREADSAAQGEVLDRFQYTKIPLAALDSLNKAIPRVRKRLGLISCPALIMQSAKDQTVAPKSARILVNGLNKTSPKVVYWANSGHILTLGPEREAVAFEVTKFIKEMEGLG